MALRVTEVGDGLYVPPVLEPTENEFKDVIAARDSPARRETPEEENFVRQVISD